MPTRRITLTDTQESLIRCLLAGGRYHSADEILHDGMRLLERRETQDAAKQEASRLIVEVDRAARKNNGYADYSRPDCWITQLDWPQKTGSG